jgi:Ni/Co efflux regulator RcnB
MHIKKLLSSLVIVGGLLLGAALPQLQAEDMDRCQRRVIHAEHELHRAIEKHGRNSESANHERRELRAARERCWRERHRWWDEHEHRWHTERDWDEHDHDRD